MDRQALIILTVLSCLSLFALLFRYRRFRFRFKLFLMRRAIGFLFFSFIFCNPLLALAPDFFFLFFRVTLDRSFGRRDPFGKRCVVPRIPSLRFENLLDQFLGNTLAQGQRLTLAYARSLVRRKSERLMQWQDQADEIKIALVGRARPIFGFINEEDVVATLPAKRADAELKGSLIGVVALCGQ